MTPIAIGYTIVNINGDLGLTGMCPKDTPWPMKCHDLHHTGRSPYSTAHIDGTEKWRFKTEGWVQSGMAIDSAPALAEDGTISVGSWDNSLHTGKNNTTLLHLKKTITVDDDGNADYKKIQDAIDAAQDGDNILVMPGTYNENIVVDKMLDIEGKNGADVTIINSRSGTRAYVVLFITSYITMKGFTVKNGRNLGVGIVGDDSQSYITDICISDCIIRNNDGLGIYLKFVSDCSITRCQINNNEYPSIFLDDYVNSVDIDGCTSNNNGRHVGGGWIQPGGITILASGEVGTGPSDISIKNCNIYENFGSGIDVMSPPKEYPVENIEIYNNHIYGNTFAMGVCLSNVKNVEFHHNNIHENWYLGIIIFNCFGGFNKNISVYENTIINNGIEIDPEIDPVASGVFIQDCLNCITLQDNIISSNYQNGLFLFRSSDNIIIENELISNIREGIILTYDSHSNGIIGNRILDNQGNGINLSPIFNLSSSHNAINDNIVSNNSGKGIHLYISNDNIIRNNGIYLNKQHGIEIGNSSNNIVAENVISSNHHLGLKIEDDSENNCIYHNNFINNSINAYDEGSNTWDDGTEGNFWDDYTGKDTDGNGIGDTAYGIEPYPLLNKDNYPLIDPINHPPIKPNKPDGPTSGKAGIEHTYTSSTTDIDGNKVFYLFDWGNETNSEWIGPFESGETASASHTWTEEGEYEIRVMAKDSYGVESDWSDPLSVSMPRNRIVNNPMFTKFIDGFMERFPLFARLINLQ